MNKRHTLGSQFIANILLLSLCLQSCGGGNYNLIVPIKQNQVIPVQTHNQAIITLTNIEPLVGQKLSVEGGHDVTFYEEAGTLKAAVEMNAPKGFSKTYERLSVTVEQGVELANLSRLDGKAQERRIHLQLAKGRQPAKVVIYKGAGLSGGGKDKGKEKLLEVVQYLLDKGADINVQTENGQTPLHIATEQGHMEIVKVLEEKGVVMNI